MNHGVSIDASVFDMIVSGGDVVDNDGWELLVDLTETALEEAIADLTGTGGRMVPFIVLARVEPVDPDDTDDPYWETGDGD
jgi:hypothetical protein